MTLLGHALGAALYLLAAVLGWRPARGDSSRRSVAWLLGAGSLAHAVGFYGMHLSDPPVPLHSSPAAVSLIGWLVVMGYLCALPLARVRSAAAWVGLVGALFTLGAEVGLQLSAADALEPAGGIWSHAHVLLSTAGFSMLTLASLAGLGYLAKERSLKRKSGRGVELPSLESLDRAEHLALSSGFVLLTLGVATGFAWGAARELSPWTGHSAFLLAAWAVYLLPVGLRIVQGQHGPRPARSVVAGFAFLAFSYLGIRVIGAVA